MQPPDFSVSGTMPAQPVDATLSNRLSWHNPLARTDLYGTTQSEPKQGFVLFVSTLANEITVVGF